MGNYTMRSYGWSVLFSVLIHAVIGMTVLCATSCRSHHTEERTTIRGDSLQWASLESVTVERVTEGIPGDSVELIMEMTAIASLPDGAEFSRKEGRTRVSVKKEGDKLIANATTDSVAHSVTRVEHLARDTLRLGRLQVTGKRDETVTPRRTFGWSYIIIMVVIGLGVTFFIYKARKG